MARYTKTKRAVKKVGVKDDMQRADEIQDGLEKFFEQLVNYKWLILSALGALFVLVVGYQVLTSRVQSSKEVAGADVGAVIQTLAKLDPAADEATRKAAVDKTISDAETFIQKHGDAPVSATLKLVKAAALIRGERYAEAVTLLSSLAGEPSLEALQMPMALALARAQKAAGDAKAALATLQAREATGGRLGGLLVARMLGDLYNPEIGDAKADYKDKTKALEVYEKAVAPYGEEGGVQAQGIEADTRNEIEKRITFLKG